MTDDNKQTLTLQNCPLRLWPEPCLLTPTKEVSEEMFGTDDLKALIKFLRNAMVAYKGIGIAANQMGFNLRLALVDLPGARDYPETSLVMCNPEITRCQIQVPYEEGCLSVPNQRTEIYRYNRVEVRYRDEAGKFHNYECMRLPAFAIQHEIDHLDGKAFFERCESTLKKDIIRRKMLKLRKRGAKLQVSGEQV
jgi:peptide deformylase